MPPLLLCSPLLSDSTRSFILFAFSSLFFFILYTSSFASICCPMCNSCLSHLVTHSQGKEAFWHFHTPNPHLPVVIHSRHTETRDAAFIISIALCVHVYLHWALGSSASVCWSDTANQACVYISVHVCTIMLTEKHAPPLSSLSLSLSVMSLHTGWSLLRSGSLAAPGFS